MDGVGKFNEGVGVVVDVFPCLFEEELDVEVSEMLVHVLATGIGEVLAVQETGLELSALHQA